MLDTSIAEFDYNEQQAMTQLHILPDDYERQDFFRMAEVMSALPEDERPISGQQYLKSLGVDSDSGVKEQNI